MTYERRNIANMQGYVPGEQPERPDVIKLNTNENPYPPGPAVAATLAGLRVESLRRYPPPTARPLREALARLHAVDSDNLIVTNGGDELLRLLLATFVEPGELVATAAPSYSLYDVLAAAHGCELRHFPLQDDWKLPATLADDLNAAGVKLCFIVNPNAPSGVLNDRAAVEDLLQHFKGVLVLDEAYADFIDPELQHNCVPLIRRFENLVILRTFSKGYSLAGLRMAYGIGARSIIDPMQHKTKDSYNTDFIAQALATAAVEDQDYARDTWRRVREERSRMRAELDALGLSSPLSQSNFLLVQVPPALDAEKIYLGLKDAGILVRYFKLPGLTDRLRITIGTPEENQRLLQALRPLLEH
jgi:histidinol-phosphate aminotransferase